MSKEILASMDEFEDRVAIVENGQVMEIYVAREERLVGSIYKGKVVNILPGMQAAFVDIGLEKNAFLCIDDVVFPTGANVDELDEESKMSHQEISKRYKEVSIEDLIKLNKETLVQVIKEPVGRKGSRITTNITLPGRYLVFLPMANYIGISRKIEDADERNRLRTLIENIKPKDAGLIIRTAAEGKSEEFLSRDLEFLKRLWEKITNKASQTSPPILIYKELSLVFRTLRDQFLEDVDKFIIDSPEVYEKVLEFTEDFSPSLKSRIFLYKGSKPLFELYNIEQEIDRALKRRVWLPSGGYIVIENTEALTTIDVNTGKFVGTVSLADTILKTNLEAAVEIARQLRLRDLGGIIIVDFIDMEKEEDKNKVIQVLQDLVKKDRVKTYILGMSPLGLVEITRKRMMKNLDMTLREDCFFCNGKGRVFTPQTMCIRLERELKKQAIENRSDAVMIICPLQVGLEFAGWEGEHIEILEKALAKSIFMKIGQYMHAEKFNIRFENYCRLKEQISVLEVGDSREVDIIQAHPLNFHSGVALLEGQLVEIINGGNRIGERVKIRLVKVNNSYALAELVDV